MGAPGRLRARSALAIVALTALVTGSGTSSSTADDARESASAASCAYIAFVQDDWYTDYYVPRDERPSLGRRVGTGYEPAPCEGRFRDREARSFPAYAFPGRPRFLIGVHRGFRLYLRRQPVGRYAFDLAHVATARHPFTPPAVFARGGHFSTNSQNCVTVRGRVAVLPRGSTVDEDADEVVVPDQGRFPIDQPVRLTGGPVPTTLGLSSWIDCLARETPRGFFVVESITDP